METRACKKAREATARAREEARKAAVLGKLLTDNGEPKDARYLMMTRHMSWKDAVTCMQLNKSTVTDDGNREVLLYFVIQLEKRKKKEKAKIRVVPDPVVFLVDITKIVTVVDNKKAHVDAVKHNRIIELKYGKIQNKQNKIWNTLRNSLKHSTRQKARLSNSVLSHR